jgi:hypothetical protein
MYIFYWLNLETQKVMASEKIPYGEHWIEITKTEYDQLSSPLGSTYTQEFDEFSDADPGL